MQRMLTRIVLPLTLTCGLAGTAWATTNVAMTDHSPEVQAQQASAMSLGQAIAAAEAQSGGLALAAEWDRRDRSRSWGYEVEVAAEDGWVQTWFVRPEDGSAEMIEQERDDWDD